VVHAKSGDFLEEAKNIFAFTPSVQHHRNCTNVHAVSSKEQKVATHSVEFAQQHAHPCSAFWNVAIDAKKFFYGQ